MEENYTYEVCPICDKEVRLVAEMKIQECPECGSQILPCSLCDPDTCDCKNCDLENHLMELRKEFPTMERLVIIDHKEHRLYIEDVTDEALAKYNGDEQEYIEDNYNFLEGEYSWDYVIESLYIDCNDPDPREINFKKSIE